MINKITGYSGFRSYAELQYPTQKQGKQLQLMNKVWQSTSRDADKINPLNNYHYQKTLYKQNYTENTAPKDYHPEHVPKGGHSTLNFAANSITKAYDKEQQKQIMGATTKERFLQTGVEHWRTNYQEEMSKTGARTIGMSNGMSLAKTQGGEKWTNDQRAQSLRKAEQESKKDSYKNRAYINNCQTGITEYKFAMGAKIGSKPTDLLNHQSLKQPLIEHPLKRGTNQLWTQIPGYQGFKPSQIPFSQLKAMIEGRQSKQKGNKKLNLTENYHVNVPGYAGFKPKYVDLGDKLRESCLSYK